MRLRFDETTLTKNPLNPISVDVSPAAAPSVANYLDLCHLPAPCLAWLFTRTPAQLNAAGMIGKVAADAGMPIQDAALLRTDHNVLVLMVGSGKKIAVYPDGAIGHEGQIIASTPEDVMSVIGAEAAPGMAGDVQYATTGDLLNIGGMDTATAPGMEPEEPVLGQVGDPVEMVEPMVDSDFFGDHVEGSDPAGIVLGQIGATEAPADPNLALADSKGRPARSERRLR